jgi:hypothetical protein
MYESRVGYRDGRIVYMKIGAKTIMDKHAPASVK